MAPTPQRRTLNPWPIAIIAFFACFITATVGFIVFSTFHGVDLVRADYYDQEVRYQEQIDRLARTRAVQAQVQMSYDPATQIIKIVLPPDHAAQQPSGQIHLYRPSAAHLDRRLDLNLTAAGCQFVEAGSLTNGLWRVRVSWAVGPAEYFSDHTLVITNRPS